MSVFSEAIATSTATAFFIDSSDIRRPKRVAELLFLIVANAEQTSTATVTVFIPPAVPTGEPPININNIENSDEPFERFS